MAKRGKGPRVAVPIPLESVSVKINWSKCCICQSDDRKDLRCPGENPAATEKCGYVPLAGKLEQLKSSNLRLASGYFISNLDCGRGILKSFQDNKAKWHKSCTNRYLDSRFEKLLASIKEKGEESEDDSKKEPTTSDESAGAQRVTRSSVPAVNLKAEVCFFCNMPGSKTKVLRNCATDFQHDFIKRCATALNDTLLLATLQTGGDLVAMEAKYHLVCLVKLYNRYRRAQAATSGDNEESNVMCEGIVFVELLLFIQEKLQTHGRAVVFKMSDLRKLYHTRLSQLHGVPESSLTAPHTTRFREKILANFPQLTASLEGREYILRHDKSNILSILEYEDQDSDALGFHRLALNLRKTISAASVSFKGQFEEHSERNSVPPALLAVVNTLLYGKAVPAECGATKAALTISQLIVMNFQERAPTGDIMRIKKTREPPLPVFTALNTYGQTRSKSIIDGLHERGMSVSSNRVSEITSQMCHLAVERARDEGIFCPAILEKGLFTVAAIDNIDHNPSSSTSEQSFHGTGISMFQLPSLHGEGFVRHFKTNFNDVTVKGRRSIPALPDSFALVPDFFLQNPRVGAPYCTTEHPQDMAILPDNFWRKENPWFRKVIDAQIDFEGAEAVGNVSWAAFHASEQQRNNFSGIPAINSMLPLFHESSKDVSMIKHGMDVVANMTHHLNNGQVPVMCGDQLTYTAAKLVQWNCPEKYSEEKFVMLLGPLHIEKSFLVMIGQLLDGSGWKGVVSNSGIVTDGSAEAILKVVHIKRSRHMYEVTASALSALLHEAYESSEFEDESFDAWVQNQALKYPTFQFWLNILNIIVLLLCFVRSVRKGDFELYKISMKHMCPLYFALNHQNYARWLPVHVRDMYDLQEKVPSVYSEFVAGKFSIPITGRPFSRIGVDHAHEQNNAKVKESGGAVGLTNDPAALRRWTVAGPEICRLLSEFKEKKGENEDFMHHEQYKAFQEKFLKQFHALKNSFLDFQNPFDLDCGDLLILDSRVVASKETTQFMRSLNSLGASAYDEFVKERLMNNTKSIHDPIKKSPMHLFSEKKTKQVSREGELIETLTKNNELYSRLFAVASTRKLDMDTFFKFENQKYPPSLAINDRMRPERNKNHLLAILEELAPKGMQPETCDAIVVDGAVLVHFLPPRDITTFTEYFDRRMLPHLLQQVQRQRAQRLDVVWDLYFPDSTKAASRQGRGNGVRRKDLPLKDKIPPSWTDYLKNSENKTELFEFLASALLKSSVTVQIVTNEGAVIKSTTQNSSLCGLECGRMEEADGRLIWHTRDAAVHGAKRVLIIGSDTDVLVIAVSHFFTLQAVGLEELWLLCGAGLKRRYIPMHMIAEALGKEDASALRGFHSFSACDQVSSFVTKQKRSHWNTWRACPQVTEAFKALGEVRDVLPERVHELLQVYVANLYASRQQLAEFKDEQLSLDKVRRVLFEAEHKLHHLPPTEAALHQHTLRAAYQAGQIWGRVGAGYDSNVPPPEGWGWKKSADGSWTPHWTDLPWIWEGCRELDVKCGCKTPCRTMRCICRASDLPCIKACKSCHANCSNNQAFNADVEQDDDIFFQ